MSESNDVLLREHPVVGRCIYCFTTEDLTDEHTVPYSLNGALKLKKASCRRCAAITSTFERSVTRDTLEVARHVMQYNTRRPRRRRESYPVEVIMNGEAKTIQMPVHAYAAPVVLIDLGFPTYLTEKYSLSGPEYKIGRRNMISVTVSRDPARTKAFLDSIGAERLNAKTTLDAYEFARVVAKIAYCETIQSLCSTAIQAWSRFRRISFSISSSAILNNPFYIGLIRLRRTGETFTGSHQPIIGEGAL